MSCTVSSAQKILKQLTTDEGLSEIKCFDVFQDSKGYMWIGTSAGANKYDGKDVIIFDRSNGLLSDHIYAFHEDNDERIWINNLNGEPLYIKDNKVHNRYTDPYLENIKGKTHFIGFGMDTYNKIWFGHNTGEINILDQDTVLTLVMEESINFDKYLLFGIIPYMDEMIIISSKNIKSIDTKTFKTNWIYQTPETRAFIRKIIHKDKLYLMHLFDTYVFDLSTKEFKTLKRFDGNPPIYDCRILNDEIYISTADGISIIRDSIIEDYNLHPSIDSIAVSAVHEDDHGDLWIATLENGLYTYYNSDIETGKFPEYCDILFIDEFSKDSLFIIKDDWNINLIKDSKLEWKKALYKIDENRFNNLFYKNGELWIADKYQLHIDVEGDYRLFDMYSRQVYYNAASNGFYWIGTKGFSFLNDIDKIFEYKNLYKLLSGLKDSVIHYPISNPYVFEVDKDLNFWVGGEEGLFYIHDNKMDTLDNPELKGSITDISLIDDRLIGVNYGNGLFYYNIKNGDAKLLTKEDGLATNHFTYLEVNGNDVWVTHATGICLLKND